MTEAAAVVAVALLAAIVVFQAALAFGAPWGERAWGGQNPGVLPARLRIGSAVAALVIYPLAILVVLGSADLVELPWLDALGRWPIWILAALTGIGAIANFASRSRPERMWGPVALAIAIGCVIVAIGG